jgi:hypothetical protein
MDNKLKPDCIVRGSIFPGPVEAILVTLIGNSIKLIGKGLASGRVYEPVGGRNQGSFERNRHR